MSRPKERFGSKLSFIFAFMYVITVYGRIYGQQLSLEDMKTSSQDELSKAFSKKGTPGGMWFGPRLGKRTLHGNMGPNLGLPLHRLLIEAMADPKHVEDYPDIRVNSIGSKRRFTPRLGRESGEQEMQGNARNVDFIPRLGRELSPAMIAALLAMDDDIPSSLLYGRSTAEDRVPLFTESKAPPFAPRLGRELADLYGASLDLKDNGIRVARSADSSEVHKKQESSRKNLKL